MGRLLGVDCGSGQWGQTFSYDNYDNLSKSVISSRIGTTWTPGYNSSNNHCTGCTYDSDGDVTGDGNNVYGWNEFAKMKWTATSGTPTCGTSGRCLVYDAFGRIVEQSNGSTWYERWITQLGETAYMSGASPVYAYWPAPGGHGKVLILGNSSDYDYLHYDWLGNARITSGNSHVAGTDQAYSPYGEIYDIFGSGAAEFETFAGLTGDFAPAATTPVVWDTPNRELSMVGRWLSPDPAGAGWNQYAYPANPLSSIDPSGLSPLTWDNMLNNVYGGFCNGQPNCTIGPDNVQKPMSQATVQNPTGTVYEDNGSTTYYSYGSVSATITSYQELSDPNAWITLPFWLGAPSEPGADLVFGTFNAPGAALNDAVCSGDPVCGLVLGVGLAAMGGGVAGDAVADETAETAAGSFVFRGVETDPETVFNEGFSPKGDSMDLLAHAWDSDNPPSGYVATSTSADVASGYGSNVYVLRMPDNAIDVNATLGASSPYPGDLEMAVPGSISPSQIRAVTIPSQGVSILNPNYVP